MWPVICSNMGGDRAGGREQLHLWVCSLIHVHSFERIKYKYCSVNILELKKRKKGNAVLTGETLCGMNA